MVSGWDRKPPEDDGLPGAGFAGKLIFVFFVMYVLVLGFGWMLF